MYLNLLDIVAGSDKNYYFENFGEALIYALIGFLIVFVGISIIIVIIWLLGLLFKKTDNLAFLRGWGAKIKAKRAAKNSSEQSEIVDNSDEISDEVKAAIIAAIMAYYCEEKPQCEFKVKRIKRI